MEKLKKAWRLKSALLTFLILCFIGFSNVVVYGTTNDSAQNGIKVTGTVTDNSGEPVIGVSVVVTGTSKGVMTDVNGQYAIEVPEKQSRLEFRYLGYVSQTVTVGERQVINVQLTEDTKALDEVVVVGYGTQKKASLTGAISQIRGEEAFKDRGINNVSVALQGEIPGLVVTRSSTRPGSEGAAMKIRGDISVNGNSSPLVLIDGIAGSLDELNQMEPNDIENISVLKDASAAIYGARSASGVMLVTTKRGKKGKAKITYNGSVSNTIDGIQTPLTSIPVWLNMFYDAQYQDAIAQNPTLTDPKEIHGKINWWIFGSVLGGDKYTGEDLFNALLRGENFNQTLSTGRITRYEPTSLMDAMYGQANSQKHSFSVSGADDKFGYMASLGFADNNSQLRVAQDGEKKYSGRLNMDYQATKALKFETGMSYEIRDITTPRADIGQGYTDPWFWPVTNPQGQYFDVFGSRNPIGGLVEGGQIKTNFNTMRSNIKATLNLSEYVDGLSISGTGGYKTVGKDIQTLTKKIQYYDYEGTMTTNRQSPGSLGEELNKWESVTLGGFLNYERSFNAVHNVSAMLGMTAEQESTKKITASRNNGPLYEESDMVDLEVMVSGTNNGAGGGQSSWGFVSYITRLNYNYQYKYLLEFLGRRDGSSRLAVSQRWKNFFAVSGGWVISEEDFMKEISLLSNLKIRYNYGKTGSVEGINNYERYATMSSGSAFFGTDITAHPSLALGGMTSDTRTWETIISHNAGLDFAFLGNRLSGSFDYFSKTNDGMFIPVTYPAILGATAPKTNNGKFSAKGWEFAIKWVDKIGDVTYNIGGSIADASSKVLELENNENVPNPGKNSNRLIGKPRDVIYAYKTDGIFQTQKEADDYYDKYYWNADHTGPKSGNIIPAPAETAINRLRPGARKVTDLDGDGAITTKDTYYAGDAAPHYTYGIKAGLEWKGIDFQAFLQGVGQQTILRTGYFAYPWVNNYMLLNSSYAGKLWTTDNPNTDYTVASRDNGFNNWNYANKDVLVQNSSYLRLKSLTIGYTLPGMWTSKVMLEKVRFYFSGDDLWEWTEIKDGYDPEYGENSNNTFPFSRLLSFGIDVTF